MSTSDFSSKDSSALERKVECDIENVPETPPAELFQTYQIQKCIDWILENQYQRTCLQFPDSMLKDAPSVALKLKEKLEKEFYILADTSYGSCCVDEIAAEHVAADSIIHFGHACLSPVSRLPVFYIFQEKNLDLEHLKSCLENRFSSNDQIIVFYDVVYYHLYHALKNTFNSSNVSISKLEFPADKEHEDECTDGVKKVLFGRSYHIVPDVNYSAVFLGSNSVTLANMVLALPDFKWYHYENEQIKEFEFNRSRFLMQRLHLIEKIKDADVIGILVGTLGVSNYLDAVERIKLLAKKKGKKCYILAVGKPNVAKLANFPEIDIFASVTCMENSLTMDFRDYYKPIVSLFEVEVALGNRPWSTEYITDFKELLPNGAFYKEGENVTETEVSLISGRIRKGDVDIPTNPGNSLELTERDPGTMIEFKGAEYLQNRSWIGLEQNIGLTPVEKAAQGRSGIPQNYSHEVSTLKNDDQLPS